MIQKRNSKWKLILTSCYNEVYGLSLMAVLGSQSLALVWEYLIRQVLLHQLNMAMSSMLTLMILNSEKSLLGLRLHMSLWVRMELRFSLGR